MKKYFIFAAVVTAGMLASCSSESLTGSDPKIEQPQEEVPIEINVATPIASAVSGTTRGSGTVGGYTDDADNVWNGQKVNVFMFEKGSLTLSTPTGSGTDYIYNNVELTTPAGQTSGIAKQYLTASTIQHKYYPQGRTFDFWGYYTDGAAGAVDATTPSESSEFTGFTADHEVRVPFTIDGTQDLMVAKTNPKAYNDLSAAQKTAFGDEATYLSKLYSASAARQSVQPNLKFKHLLTRLTFSIQGGNAAACGYPLPSDGNNYTGVFVKSIKVKSQNTGYIVAAYNRADMTGDTRFNDAANLIKFDDTTTPPATNPVNYVPLTLKGTTVTAGNLNNLYSFDITNVETTKAALEIGSTNWGQIIRPTTADGTVFDKVAVGSALLVQPRDKYDIILELGQYLLNVENTTVPASSTYTIMSSEIPINEVTTTLTDGKFKPGYSYNINITTWGYEEIQITTTLEKWINAGEVQVDYE